MSETATEEHPRRDVVNAEVFIPQLRETPFRRARVFVSSRRVVVWAEDADRQPEFIMDAPIIGDAPTADRATLQGQLTMQTAQGPVYVTRGSGCGCGSTLRLLTPPW